MSISLKTIICTLENLAKSSGTFTRSLNSLASIYDCPQDLLSIQSECAAVKASLTSLFGAFSVNDDVLSPLLCTGSLLSQACDVTLTWVVITFSHLEAETHDMFEAHSMRGEFRWRDNVMRTILQEMRAEHKAMDAIHTSVGLDNADRVIEVLSHKQIIFDYIHHHLRCAVPALDSRNGESADTFSMFSCMDHGRYSIGEHVVNSLVYQRVQYGLKSQQGSYVSRDNWTNSNIHANGARRGTPPRNDRTSETPSVSSTQESSQSCAANEVRQNQNANSINSIHQYGGSPPLPPRSEARKQPYQRVLRGEVSEDLGVAPSHSPSATGPSLSLPAWQPRQGNDCQPIPDDENLPEAVPEDLLEKMVIVESPGPSALQAVDSLVPRASTTQSSNAAQRRHTFTLRKQNTDPLTSPPTASRRRESMVSSTSGEGVWMYWLEDHAEMFGDLAALAPMTDLYLTIPLVGDSAVQKRAAIDRWLGQKSITPPKFKRNDVVVEGLADDGEVQLPLKVTFTTLDKKKNIDHIQKIFTGEAIFALCAFNIADAKTLRNVVEEVSHLQPRLLLGSLTPFSSSSGSPSSAAPAPTSK